MFDPKVHVGVGVQLLRVFEGVEEVLLIKRGANATHGASTWALPGGWIDWGQTPEEAAARELLEEVNVKASPAEGVIVGAVANTYIAEDMHVICVGVSFENYDASELLNCEPEKCEKVSWMPIHELKTLELFPPLETLAKFWGWI